MNKRISKKKERAIRKEIHRLLDLVLDINGLGSRCKEETGDLPTAFFRFSGHIGTVEAHVYDKGWGPEGGFCDCRISVGTQRGELSRACADLKKGCGAIAGRML